MLNNYICTLDISSSKISAAVAQVKRKRITNIYVDTLPSKGIQAGTIVNSIDLVGVISRILKNLRVKSGINIKFIYTNISGQDISTKHSHAIIPLAERGNKVITLSDIANVNEQARILGSSLEEEIIQVIPFNYAIDSKNNILNPVGLYSHRLEVDLYLICGNLSSIQSLTRAVNQAGYEIKDLFFSGLATASAISNKEFKQGLSMLCDIGSDTTELLLFKDGILREVEVLPLGGDNLTKHLQENLKIPFELAEDLKRSYATAGEFNQIDENKEVLVKKSNVYKPIKQKLISQVITAETKSMCSRLKEAIERLTPAYKIDNFIVAGRTVLLEGFLETLENTLGISCKLAKISNPSLEAFINTTNSLSGQKYFAYTTALGILCQVLDSIQQQGLSWRQHSSGRNPIFRIANRVKEVYQEYF